MEKIQLLSNKWVSLNGEVHYKTRYLVCNDLELTSTLIDVTKEEDIDILKSDVYIRPGQEIFVRITRYFKDSNGEIIPNSERDSDVKKIIGEIPIETNTNDTNITIDTPVITYKISGKDTIDVSTSNYNGGNTIHESTHWLVYDKFCNLKYSEIESSDLTSKTIHIEDIYTYTELKLLCIYKSNTGRESTQGILNMKTTSTIIDVTSNINNIISNTDYNLTINRNKAIINKIALVDYTGVTLWFTTDIEDIDITTTVIPGSFLLSGLNYKIIFTVVDNGLIKTDTYNITIGDNDVSDEPNINKIYESKIKKVGTIESSLLSSNLVSSELPLMKTLLNIDNVFVPYIITDELNTTTDIILNNIPPSINNDNTFMKMYDDNLLIVDTLNKNSKPTFTIYSYDNVSEVFTPKAIIPRTEDTSIGMKSNLIRMSKNIFKYLGSFNGVTSLITLDISTNTTSVRDVTINDNNINGMSIFKTKNNDLLITTPGGYTYRYDEVQDNFYQDILVPVSYIGRETRTVQLSNGDVLFFKVTSEPTENRVGYMCYSYKDHIFKEGEIKEKMDLILQGYIDKLNGEIILIFKDNDKSVLYKYY